MGCSPWSREESDTNERLHFHFSLPCIGEGNGNPLQCSCLENLGTGEPGGLPSLGSHRVTQSWTELKQLSSSSINLEAKLNGKLSHFLKRDTLLSTIAMCIILENA